MRSTEVKGKETNTTTSYAIPHDLTTILSCLIGGTFRCHSLGGTGLSNVEVPLFPGIIAPSDILFE
jgi:hypothetical protein